MKNSTRPYFLNSNPISPWLLAIRPRTLPAAISPVILGTALAIGDGALRPWTVFLCFLGAIIIQIGTNLANDYYDFKKGSDTSERIGPVRVTQAGLIAPVTVRNAFIVAFAIAFLIAVELAKRGGWPILIIGILSIISGIFYTAGPKPLGYNGLGEIFVFIFFGPVAVAGTYFVQRHEINPAVILAGVAPGLLSAAILVVNNLRDIETDRIAGKRTISVRFGKEFSQILYYLLIAVSALMPLIIFTLIQERSQIFLASVIILFAAPTIRSIFCENGGPVLNKCLANTGLLLLLYCLLFSFGWLYADLRF